MSVVPNVLALEGLHPTCMNCPFKNRCLPCGIPQSALEHLDRSIVHRPPAKRGEILYRQSERLSSFYVVRSGCVKNWRINEAGHYQVEAFHLPSEFLGFDAISTRRHPVSAVALETSSVCEVPYKRLTALLEEFPSLQELVLELISEQLRNEKRLVRMIADQCAEARLACFLLDLALRNRRCGHSATKLSIPMTRADIANYLGTSLETISRLFGHFRREGLITESANTMHIADIDMLENLANMPLRCVPDETVRHGEAERRKQFVGEVFAVDSSTGTTWKDLL